jgi:chemotaxis protein MotB
VAGRKKDGGHENLERWLVSYADFMTLMFALFVVLFASSETDKAKAQRVSESVRRALDQGEFASAVASILGGRVGDRGKSNPREPGGNTTKPEAEKPPQYLAELLPSLEYLNKELESEILAGKVRVHMEGRGLVVSLMEAAFFQSGDDTVLQAMYPSIDKIAAAIAALPNPVRLEGHTDSVPIHNSRFRSNWELSAARSIAMLNLFVERNKLPPSRLAVAGYADNVPVAGNDTEEGRARNRRVDIVILNKAGFGLEPGASQKSVAGDGQKGAPEAAAAGRH